MLSTWMDGTMKILDGWDHENLDGWNDKNSTGWMEQQKFRMDGTIKKLDGWNNKKTWMDGTMKKP